MEVAITASKRTVVREARGATDTISAELKTIATDCGSGARIIGRGAVTISTTLLEERSFRMRRRLSRERQRKRHLLAKLASGVRLAVLPVVLAEARPALDLTSGASVSGKIRGALGGIVDTAEEALEGEVEVPAAILSEEKVNKKVNKKEEERQ